MNAHNHHELMVDTILVNPSEVDTNLFTSQFIINETKINKYKKMYPHVPLNSNQLACLYKKLSEGIIDISKSLPSSKTSNEVVKKMSTNARKIIEEQNKLSLANKLKEDIGQIKQDEIDIITGDKPTISSLEGIIHNYSSIYANRIIKIIILRSLIQRYSDTGNEYLVLFIFEFRNEILEFKNKWIEHVDNVNTTIEKVEQTTTKVNHRKARMQKTVVSTGVAQFDYPTVDELLSDEFSERIKSSTRLYYNNANTILQRVNINPIRYQMVESYWRLKPLSTWDKQIKKLDEWQITAINMIEQNKSILITAPTSSGKTVIAQYCAIKDLKQQNNTKVLFVVPNSILATQVAGTFSNSGIRAGLYTNENEYGNLKEVNVIVATPSKAEELLCTSQLEPTYTVFDEIQQINGFEGETIERLIRVINCPFLVLSATIHEPRNFCNFLAITSQHDVELITYNKRFIVQQKHVWNGNELITLHPLNCIDVDYIVQDKFVTGDLAMTARDVYVMGCDMAKHFDDSSLHPENHFDTNEPINVPMVESFEKYLKGKLVEFALNDPNKVHTYLESYNSTNTDWILDESEIESPDIPVSKLIDMFKTLNSKKLLPALCFMMNNFAVMDVYKNIVTKMESVETHYFPWYHNFMEHMHEYIQSFIDGENTLKESISKGIAGRGNKQKQIQDTLNQHRRRTILDFLSRIETKYECEILRASESTTLSDSEKQMITNFLKQDYAYKHRIHYASQINAIEVKLPVFNPYAPTSLFSFHKNPLSVEVMRDIKAKLKKFARQSAGSSVSKDISYDNIYLRGIERGIVLYSSNMPASFQRIIQELIVNNHAPVCIADDSLAYGVNFPTRTVVMLGATPNEIIDVSKGTQMSGRSGRRGYDTQGHIVYCRINYKKIMRGTYVPFVGKDTITPFSLLPGKIFEDPQYILNVLKKPLNLFNSTDYQIQPILDEFANMYREDEIFQQDGIMSLSLWYYRDESDIAYNIFTLVKYLINYIPYTTIEIEIIKKNKKNIDDDDIELCDINESGNKINFKMEASRLNQIIELLYRVFDYEPLNEETSIEQTKIPDIISSELWPIPLNKTNCKLIDCIIKKSANIYSGNNVMIEKLICRTQHVVLCAVKLYNLFVDIGNENLIAVLNPAINAIKSFNDKLKLIDQSND